MSKETVLDEMYDVLQERKKIQRWFETGEITKSEFDEHLRANQMKMEVIRKGQEPVKIPVRGLDKSEEVKPDVVNHPPHYANRKYEVIDVMEDTMTRERFIGYLEGCTHKYLARWDKKGKPLQDLEKARWYLNKLIQTIEEEAQ